MSGRQIAVRQMTREDVDAIARLLIAQNKRLFALDKRLEDTESIEELAEDLVQQLDDDQENCFVAQDERGYVRGLAHATVWDIPEQGEMRAFFSARNGTFDRLVLPNPHEEDVYDVARALLDALDHCWQRQQTTGELVRLPRCDLWLEPLILERKFLVDNELAYRAATPFVSPSDRTAPLPLQTRLARREDEEVLVQLYWDELRFHVAYTPFVHLVPPAEHAFRARLARLWAGESVDDDVPLVVVVEQAGEIVAMAENELLVVEKQTFLPFLLPGRYAYLNNVSVREGMRGQGIGHELVEGVFAVFADKKVDGYMLWYSYDNPAARNFWALMGFKALWRTYQRLH